ncbi:MAG: DUF4091 domain-containing protein [Sedimentisphaerales bacterium]|nr:DUF4091 domain-containing protein [Sedimentisphaerales bacterium]
MKPFHRTGCVIGTFLIVFSFTFLKGNPSSHSVIDIPKNLNEPDESKNLLKNPGFEEGIDSPSGWTRAEANGVWETKGYDGKRCISVKGNGQDNPYWRQDASFLHPGKTYRLDFYARTTGNGGNMISGPDYINRDFNPTNEWEEYSFIFTPRNDPTGGYIRLGQWHRNDTTIFDNVVLTEVVPVHITKAKITLGAGESLRNGLYTFNPQFSYEGSNYSRPLEEFTCGFNSNRWTFGPNQYLIYKHKLGDVSFTEAMVKVHIGYYTSGACIVECSKDKQIWERLGFMEGLISKEFDVPAALLPAKELYVRLRASGSGDKVDDVKPGSFQIYGYTFRSKVNTTLAIQGESRFLEVLRDNDRIDVEVLSLGDLRPGANTNAVLQIRNKDNQPIQLSTYLTNYPLDISPDKLTTPISTVDTIKPGMSCRLSIPYSFQKSHTYEMTICILDEKHKTLLYEVRTKYHIPPLYDASYGYYGGQTNNLSWWWCEGTYKVSRERPVPSPVEKNKRQSVTMSACRGEYEPVQVVLRPDKAISGLTANVTGDTTSLANATKVYQVAYHYVHRATDSAGCEGWWPDALPPLDTPIRLEANQNQPLWILTKIPTDCPAGDHALALTVEAEGMNPIHVPITVHVYDFTMPYPGHVETAFGLSAGNIKQYHNLETEAEQRQVWDLYMQDFREHRISPYDFAPFDRIRQEWRKTGSSDQPKIRSNLDFSEWDRQAKKYLDEYGFNGFRLGLAGMGGGTFHSRYPGKIGPYEQGTTEYRDAFKDYCMQLQNHLQQNGWLDKAYIYWFDEPDPKDYQFVIDGMNEIKLAGPKLRRMLTEEPIEELCGSVDIWCPVLHNYSPEACQARQQEGEKIWWYVCTGPKAPYPGLFIDHNAIDLRIWLWMTWKWNVQGILVWESNYWTSNAAFPPPGIQNPWDDPMGYVSGYSHPAGFVGYWGNGDGRFLYPPNRDVEKDKQKYLAGPVSSIRWEMLREGLEDFEYFQLLVDAIKKAKKTGVAAPTIAHAEQLLSIPANLIEDKTHFTQNPQLLYKHRISLANAIEELNR